MNTRTNLRTWRDNACYIVQVGLRGSKTNPHIYAELKAIAIDTLSKVILSADLEKFSGTDKLYWIKGERTAQKAIERAVKQFKSEK